MYVIIVGFGDTPVGRPFRIIVLGFLALTAARLRARRTTWSMLALSVTLLIAVILAVAFASPLVASGVVGASSLVLTIATMAIIASTLRTWWIVDTATVLGVLCVYLLFALLFASLHQLLAAFTPHYLNGVSGRPTSSDLLYFSVITIATVGFGDITPASGGARAVALTEALLGQLYLVSVVAVVVGGWRREKPDRDAD